MEQEVRLIDANKLKNHYAWWENGTAEMTLAEAKRDFDTIIDVQPEAIIHCRDCDYYYPMGNDWCGYCSMIARGWTDAILPSDFCSRGVRREEERLVMPKADGSTIKIGKMDEVEDV